MLNWPLTATLITALVLFALLAVMALRRKRGQESLLIVQSTVLPILVLFIALVFHFVTGNKSTLEIKATVEGRGILQAGSLLEQARTLAGKNEFKAAVDIYRKVLEQEQTDVDVKMEFVEATARLNFGKIKEEALEMVYQVLGERPHHHHALWLAGMAAHQQKKYKLAVHYWKNLERLLPANSQEREVLEKRVAQTRAEVIAPDFEPGSPMSVEAMRARGRAGVMVRLELDARFQSSLDPEATVFLYAHDLPDRRSDEHFPLTVMQLKVSELPVTVRLNDSYAQLASRLMSTFHDVRLFAFVSEVGEGQHYPSKGDPMGELDYVELNVDKVFHLDINSVYEKELDKTRVFH